MIELTEPLHYHSHPDFVRGLHYEFIHSYLPAFTRLQLYRTYNTARYMTRSTLQPTSVTTSSRAPAQHMFTQSINVHKFHRNLVLILGVRTLHTPVLFSTSRINKSTKVRRRARFVTCFSLCSFLCFYYARAERVHVKLHVDKHSVHKPFVIIIDSTPHPSCPR